MVNHPNRSKIKAKIAWAVYFSDGSLQGAYPDYSTALQQEAFADCIIREVLIAPKKQN